MILLYLYDFFLEILRVLIDCFVIDVIILYYFFYLLVFNVNKFKGGSIRSIFNVSICCFNVFDLNGEDWVVGVDFVF